MSLPPLTKTKSQLAAEQPSVKRLETTNKDVLHPKAKTKPQQDDRMGAFTMVGRWAMEEGAWRTVAHTVTESDKTEVT